MLKTPAHLGYLDDLRRTFPDLHVVHLHRDPVETIPSGASLNATLHAMHADTVDPHRIGTQWLGADGVDQRPGDGDPRPLGGGRRRPVTDVQFEDAVSDPIGQMAGVYDAAGCRSGRGPRPACALARAPAAREGRPDYAAESYGLNEAMIRERFAEYERASRGRA